MISDLRRVSRWLKTACLVKAHIQHPLPAVRPCLLGWELTHVAFSHLTTKYQVAKPRLLLLFSKPSGFCQTRLLANQEHLHIQLSLIEHLGNSRFRILEKSCLQTPVQKLWPFSQTKTSTSGTRRPLQPLSTLGTRRWLLSTSTTTPVKRLNPCQEDKPLSES